MPTISKLALAVFAILMPLFAAFPRPISGSCQPIHSAMKKMANTPARVFTTETAGFHASETTSESIYAGGAIYTNVNGKWIRSSQTPDQMLRQEQDKGKNGRVTCRFLRDTEMNGEATAEYTTHTETADMKSDTQVWISKSRGLPLRQDVDTDVGGKLGKSHVETRYEYDNVQPPAE